MTEELTNSVAEKEELIRELERQKREAIRW
jgi:hypothetical protein